MVQSARLPVELLQEVALYLIAQTCPLPPLRPPFSLQSEMDQSGQVINNVGRLWRAPASHPVRRLSQVCSALRPFVRRHMWQVVFIYDRNGLEEMEALYRYLRCVDEGALRTWTLELTSSNWANHWKEVGPPADIGELFLWGSDWIGEDADNVLQVGSDGFVVQEEEGKLLEWPAGKPFLGDRPTRADIWAMHRFVFQQLQNAERICWRSQVDPGTMWRGSSLMHVIGALPKLQCFQVDQSYPGGWFYARNLLVLSNVREVWIDCNSWLIQIEPADGQDIFQEPDQPTIDGQPFSSDVDHRKRFLTTCNLDKLVTTHFDCFENAEVLVALACMEVVAREPLEGHFRNIPEDLELGQAAANLRPALLALATPGKLTAQDVYEAAESDPRIERVDYLLLDAAEDIVRRFNAPRPGSALQ